MKTIIVDDELWALETFKTIAAESSVIDIVGAFDRADEALAFATDNSVDFALLDIEMPGMNGIELGNELRRIYPQIILIYVTAYDDRIVEALRIKADYFITKPYGREEVEDVLQRAMLLSSRQKKRVYMRTFGSFDVFVDDVPIYFSSAKAKELLALLVDRNGGLLGVDEAISVLWEDKPRTEQSRSTYRKIAARLRATLAENGISDILVEENVGRRLDKTAFDCDYYQFLAGNREARMAFNGKYMAQYVWGEETLGALESKMASSRG